MDFKIGDDIEDINDNSSTKRKGILPVIIVIIIAIIIGVLVFLISNALFGQKEPVETPIVDTQLDTNDTTVQILYKSVTYGTRNYRNDIFIKTDSVNLSSFTNEEKYFYALQFVQQTDFEETGETDETTKQKIYILSNDKVKGYMQRFFGPQVTYNTDEKITHVFRFKLGDKNKAEMTYSEEFDGFKTVFTEKVDFIDNKEIVKPYYKVLESATRKADTSLVLIEKVIYTKVEKKDDGTYNIKISSDPQSNNLLEDINDSEENIKSRNIDILDYSEKTAHVTYTFKVNNNSYYFDNSTLETNTTSTINN